MLVGKEQINIVITGVIIFDIVHGQALCSYGASITALRHYVS